MCRLTPGTERPGSISPLCDFRQRWDNLESETVSRQVKSQLNEKNIYCFIIMVLHREHCVFEQHQLECALLGLGQFQNTLDELHAWLSHTADLLQASQPISIDLQTCEIELAKHKVQTQTLSCLWHVFICTFLPMLCPYFCSDLCSFRIKH